MSTQPLPGRDSNDAQLAAQRKGNSFGNLGRIRRMIAPAVVRPFAIVESIALMAIVLGVMWWTHPTDPLLLDSGFGWLWLAPVLLALRYGTLIGLLSGLLMLGGWYLFYPYGSAWPTSFFAGGLLQTVLVGHFGDTWGARAAQTAALNGYLNERLVALTNNHYLLRLSHDRLEKDLLAQPTTLRDSIQELRRLPMTGSGIDPETAERLLRYVSQVCRIEQAGLYVVEKGVMESTPVAVMGESFELIRNDLLVKSALDSGQLSHLKMDDAAVAESVYLVCVPINAANGTMKAMLVVKRMPFLSLTYDNLQLLLVLLGYVGDGLEHADEVHHVIDVVPDCPADFALELSRLGRMDAMMGIPASLVAVVFPRNEASTSLFDHVLRRRRALDIVWDIRGEQHLSVINLMPVTDSASVDGYIARIEASLRAQFGVDLEQARVAVHRQGLGDLDPALALQRILNRSGIHE